MAITKCFLGAGVWKAVVLIAAFSLYSAANEIYPGPEKYEFTCRVFNDTAGWYCPPGYDFPLNQKGQDVDFIPCDPQIDSTRRGDQFDPPLRCLQQVHSLKTYGNTTFSWVMPFCNKSSLENNYGPQTWRYWQVIFKFNHPFAMTCQEASMPDGTSVIKGLLFVNITVGRYNTRTVDGEKLLENLASDLITLEEELAEWGREQDWEPLGYVDPKPLLYSACVDIGVGSVNVLTSRKNVCRGCLPDWKMVKVKGTSRCVRCDEFYFNREAFSGVCYPCGPRCKWASDEEYEKTCYKMPPPDDW